MVEAISLVCDLLNADNVCTFSSWNAYIPHNYPFFHQFYWCLGLWNISSSLVCHCWKHTVENAVCQPLAHMQLIQLHCHCPVCLCWQQKCSQVDRCRCVQQFCSIEDQIQMLWTYSYSLFLDTLAETVLESCCNWAYWIFWHLFLKFDFKNNRRHLLKAPDS